MRRILTIILVACWPSLLWASPGDEARARAIATFDQAAGSRLPVDQALIEGKWEPVPFDPQPFTYTFDEIRDRWPHLMRGLKIPYPSPAYLRERYTR